MTGDHNRTGSAELPIFNPLAANFAADPYRQYRELVAHNPIQQSLFGPWMLFRYDDCVRFLRDPLLSVEDTSVAGPNPRAELRERVFGERAQRGTRSILIGFPTTPYPWDRPRSLTLATERSSAVGPIGARRRGGPRRPPRGDR